MSDNEAEIEEPTTPQTWDVNEAKKLFDDLVEQNCLVDVREGLQTFLIYVSNIIKHPQDPKFRKIRIANLNYQVRLGHLKGGPELLKYVGYVKKNGFLILPKHLHNKSNTDDIKKIRNLSNEKLEQVNKKFRTLERLERNYKFKSITHCVESHTIGKRNSMEDDFYIVDEFCNKKKWSFFALYDGHGGRATVDHLTCSFHLNLEHLLLKQTENSDNKNKTLDSNTITNEFKNCFEYTDNQIQRQQIYQSGATACIALIANENDSKMLYVANVGDTRAVLCRKEQAIRLTKDHKASDIEEANMIKKRGGFIGRFSRVNGLLAVTRAFGDHLLKPPVSVLPYIKNILLTDDDYFFIIACDGLWDVCDDDEVVKFILSQLYKKANVTRWKDININMLRQYLTEIVDSLIQLALDRKSMDNVSIIIIVP